MKKNVCFPFFTIVLGILLLSLNGDKSVAFMAQVAANFERFEKGLHQEKLYLHFDKPSYLPGERMWFKAYLVDATDMADIAFSQFIYVELADSAGIVKQRVMIKNEKGSFDGHIDIPKNTPTACYYVRAYSSWMRNAGDDFFFAKPLYIGKASTENKANTPEVDNPTDFSLQLFPEGGYPLAGTKGIIAFKSVGSDGLGVNVTGVVVDSQNKAVAHIKSEHKGMGQFELEPQEGETYNVLVTSEYGQQKGIELPTKNPFGVALQVSHLQEKIFYALRHTKNDISPLYLLVHSQGRLLAFTPLNQKPSGRFLEAELPEGIVHFAVVDEQCKPLLERLIYIRKAATTHVAMAGKMDGYNTHEKAEVDLLLTNTDGDSVKGSFSVSIIDMAQVQHNDFADNIYSNLLLTSDIKGYVEEPGFYFSNPDTHTDSCLDMLMLTQAWRRFNVGDIVMGKEKIPAYPLEIGQTMSGKTKNWLGGVPKTGTIHAFSKNKSYYGTTAIDENGRFVVAGMDFPDSTTFIVYAENKNRFMLGVEMDKESYPLFYPQIPGLKKQKLLNSNLHMYYVEDGTEEVITLMEATSTAAYLDATKPKYGMSQRYALGDAELAEVGNIPAVELLRRFGGVRVIEDDASGAGDSRVKLALPRSAVTLEEMRTSNAGIKTPVVMLDGMLIRDPDILYSFYSDDIKHMELVFGPAASRFMVDFNVPVIVIESRYGEPRRRNSNEKSYIAYYEPLGYQKRAEFYQPTYNISTERLNKKPDFRSTLYWNPNIMVDESGKAHVRFYTNDSKAGYTLILEGITNKGRLCRYVGTIGCKS